jgi:hypothetical protein
MRSRAEVDAALAARGVPDAGMRSFVAQNLVAREGGGYAWRVNLPGLLASLPAFAGFPRHLAPQPDLPAAFIRGATSSYVTPAHHAPTGHTSTAPPLQ